MNNPFSLTPRQIVEELDKYIIGQHDAKRNVAIALRNRIRRMNVTSDIQKDIVPNNILLIGSTGVGKTEIARRLAKIAQAPFIKVEASKFTEVGYVGRDVESMVRDLMEQSVQLVRESKKAEVNAKATEAVEEVILDILIPSVKTPGFTSSSSATDSSEPSSEAELNERTRDRFREKLRNNCRFHVRTDSRQGIVTCRNRNGGQWDDGRCEHGRTSRHAFWHDAQKNQEAQAFHCGG